MNLFFGDGTRDPLIFNIMAARAVYREFFIYVSGIFKIVLVILGVWEYSHWIRLEILHILPL